MRRLAYLQELGKGVALKSISLKVGHRYGYYAIDIYHGGRCLDTLVAGLSAGECERILTSIGKVLYLDRKYLEEDKNATVQRKD